MTFTSTWQELIEECEEVSEDATFVTPTTDRRFRISHVEDDQIDNDPVILYMADPEPSVRGRSDERSVLRNLLTLLD